VNTLLLHADPNGLDHQNLRRVLDALESGLPVALPTETVYGLAADALRPEAAARIFDAKERPLTDPLIVHLRGAEDLESVSRPDALARKLAERFWPGPLSLVLSRNNDVPDIITAGQDTVAVRAPAHPVFQQVLTAFGKPLAAPSANRFGRISPTRAGHVMAELDGRIALVVDGGACQRGIESTIVWLRPEGLQILRPGPVTMEELATIAPIVESPSAPASPGSLPSHYAPTTPLRILGEDPIPSSWQRRGLLAWGGANQKEYSAVRQLSPGLDFLEAAANLYSAMRALDSLQLDGICAEPIPETGLGRALMDRLRRAASHDG